MGALATAGWRTPCDGHRVVDVIAEPAGYNARVDDPGPPVDRAVAAPVDVAPVVEGRRGIRDLEYV